MSVQMPVLAQTTTTAEDSPKPLGSGMNSVMIQLYVKISKYLSMSTCVVHLPVWVIMEWSM